MQEILATDGNISFAIIRTSFTIKPIQISHIQVDAGRRGVRFQDAIISLSFKIGIIESGDDAIFRLDG